MNNKIVYFSIVVTVILLRICDVFFGITGGHPINRNKILVDVAGCLSYLLIYATFSKCVWNQTTLTALGGVVVMFIVGEYSTNILQAQYIILWILESSN